MSYISFPGLGNMKLYINRVAFNLFGMEIYWYGIVIAAALMFGVMLAVRGCKKYGIKSDDFIDVMLFATPSAIIGARLYYVLFKLSDYKSIWDVFNIRNGGLAIYGGIIGALVAAGLVAKYKKIHILDLFDFGLPYFALAQAIGRWGNFFNQEAFGRNTTLPWGMQGDQITKELERLKSIGVKIDPELPVHPTFLYESIWNLLVFVVLLWFRDRKKVKGEVFFLYMILYGIGRFFIEGLRMDSLMAGSVRISQLLAILCVLLFAVILVLFRRKAGKVDNVRFGSTPYGDIVNELSSTSSLKKESLKSDDFRNP